MTRIHVLRGARAGDVLDFERDGILIGRQPEADLRFHPDTDLEVSGRHAILFNEDGGWFVRDLGSTNGTFVNGRRVAGDAAVRNGDQIEFGPGGPLIELRVDPSSPPASRTRVIRAHYARENRRLRGMTAAFGLGLVVLVGILLFVGLAVRRQRTSWNEERATLLARMDSLLAQGDEVVTSLRGEMDGLAQALRQSQAEVRDARAALERLPTSSSGTADLLRRQLRTATEALTRHQLAASVDFRGIEQANRKAVALIYVEAEDGAVTTATGFAVRADGTLLTAGHVVAGPDRSRRPRRIAVQFSDSEQFFPGRLVLLSEDVDLAVLRVENVIGDVPVVAGFNERPDTIAAGTPVAMMGFALGGETDMPRGSSRSVARPLMTAGVVTAASRERLGVQGYGAAGASGSPIFDAQGRVAGILFGGRNVDGQSTILGVPAGAATALLARVR